MVWQLQLAQALHLTRLQLQQPSPARPPHSISEHLPSLHEVAALCQGALIASTSPIALHRRADAHQPAHAAYVVTAVVRVPDTLSYHVRLVAGAQQEEYVQCREYSLAWKDGRSGGSQVLAQGDAGSGWRAFNVDDHHNVDWMAERQSK